jgi:hypothetical protein
MTSLSSPSLTSAFGHAVRLAAGTVQIHPDAAERVRALLAEWGCTDNTYQRTVDIRRLVGVHLVVQAEWVDDFAKAPYIERGYLVRSEWATDTPSLFHARTMDEVRRHLRDQARTRLPDHLPRIFARCRRISLGMVRRLGWCDPGIRAWWRRHGHGPLVDSLPVADLWRVCQGIAEARRDSYTARLCELLAGNPHRSSHPLPIGGGP